jgi:hypothetical protein
VTKFVLKQDGSFEGGKYSEFHGFCEMIIFKPILTTFEDNFVFLRQLGQYQKLARA